MKTSRKFVLLIIIGGLIATGIYGWNRFKTTIQALKTDVLTETNKDVDQNILWEKLIQCESGGRELAINTRDRDGTASLGILQYKFKTFKEKLEKYGMIGKNADLDYIATIIWDKKINKMLFFKIVNDPTENLYQLWPSCCQIIKCPRR